MSTGKMNPVHAVLVSLPVVGGIAVGIATAARPVTPPARKTSSSLAIERRRVGTAEEEVAAAEAAVRRASGRVEGYHRLATACMRSATETFTHSTLRSGSDSCRATLSATCLQSSTE